MTVAQNVTAMVFIAGMLSAIDFNDQPRSPALEIDHIRCDWGLSAKVMS